MCAQQRTVTFKGNPLALVGIPVAAGAPAPPFAVLATDLSPVTQDMLKGKVTVIITVPSLDTPVCDTEGRRFNKEAVALGANVQVVCISVDLPFAQGRWCGAAGITRVLTLSDHRDLSFGMAYGVVLKDLRLLTRAVFVIDAGGVVRYTELVPEITREPDYDAALAAVKNLAK